MRKISLFDIPDEDDRGVSPVIGVILMVAITVILAAVIATFVLGFPDQVSNNVNAGADISESSDDTATVTWISGGNAAELNVSVNHANANVNSSSEKAYTLSSVGDSVKVYGQDGSSNPITANVIVKAIGEDGTETVITQKEVTLNNSAP